MYKDKERFSVIVYSAILLGIQGHCPLQLMVPRLVCEVVKLIMLI